jgi:radical SAM-linked protein
MQMIPIRVFFHKTGRAKYISHLDVMRAMTRALGRSGLPLWFTEGFNPHLYLTFTLPLPLGYESVCESLDLRLTEEMPPEQVAGRIQAVLPPGFQVVHVAPPQAKSTAIQWADYRAELDFAAADPLELERAFADFCAQPAIVVSKRTKKGDKPMDIRPHVQVMEREFFSNRATFMLRCAAGTTLNINPTLFLQAFCATVGLQPQRSRLLRVQMRSADLQPFA